MPYSPEAINELLHDRRSVFPKMYTDESVPESVIEQMLENARWAPTHKYTEPWRFVVYTGSGLQKLGDFQAELYKKVTTADGTFKEKKYHDLREKPTKASHVIAFGMKRDPRGRIRPEEEIASVAMAVQNMHLTATAYGVGCYWASGGVTYFPEAKEHFGFGPEDMLMGFLYVGMPQADLDLPAQREPLAEKVTWVRE